MTESRPARVRTPLPGISSRAWEHPADQGALVALRKLAGFDVVFRTLSGFLRERSVRLDLLGSGVRVDERQFARLHRLLTETAATLDAPEVPEMFVVAAPTMNAMCVGMDKPMIVLNSALMDLLDEDELRFVVAHELGHALSGHAVYRTVLHWLLGLGGLLNTLPGGGVAARVITTALLEWSRKSELSADRAGLLATQDPQVAFRALMKLASGGYLEDLDPTSFFAQGQEYDEGGDLRESFLKLGLLQRQTHPYTVVRATELRRWVDGGDYTRYLGGEYPRRADDAQASATEAARAAAASYQRSFADTGDALGRMLHEMAGVVGSVRGWWDRQFGAPGEQPGEHRAGA